MDLLNQARHWLVDFGVTERWLMIAAVFFFITFMISLREILSWYFRQNEIREELSNVQNQLSDLQKELEALHKTVSRLTDVQSEAWREQKSASATGTHFPLQH